MDQELGTKIVKYAYTVGVLDGQNVYCFQTNIS